MSARNSILQSIAKGTKNLATTIPTADNPDIYVVPQHVQVSAKELLELFIDKAQAVGTTVAQCSMDQLAKEITRYLQDGKNNTIKVAPALAHLPWHDLNIKVGTANEDDKVAVNLAFAAIAETGTLLCCASPKTPTLLNFLPEVSIVVVMQNTLVATYEDAWKKLQMQGPLPRSINFITGPSRTGDIEQKLLLGIHGPRKLHIILIN